VLAFPNRAAALLPKSARGPSSLASIRDAAFAEPRSVPAWLLQSQRATADPVKAPALITRVFLPFAAGYYMSYLFRAIHAVIAAPLMLELGLGASDLGLLTSVYFLTFGAAQIPIGVLLDRYGARRIQSTLLVAASAGAAMFAVADNFLSLLAARLLIDLGVASALTAGLKALAVWFPRDRFTRLNGLMIMLGALGAVTATLPAEQFLAWTDWRKLFLLLGAATAGCAALTYFVVPDDRPEKPITSEAVLAGLRTIYSDRRFWRLAPLSATLIGTAWALHGLWAARWLADVEGLDHTALMKHLFTMAVALSLGAALFGFLADRMRRHGVGEETLLSLVAIVFMTAQLALILHWPFPSYPLWAVVAAVGATTVLSFATLAKYYPKELTGRANGALNVFHLGCAFVVQYAIGIVLQCWTPRADHYPEIAYQTALLLNLALQIIAWIWFMIPPKLGTFQTLKGLCMSHRASCSPDSWKPW
jgi:MFS family permease